MLHKCKSVSCVFFIFSSLLCLVFALSNRTEHPPGRRLHAVLSKSQFLRIVYDSFDPKAVAWASFEDKTLTEGWAYLHVETNPEFPDDLTAYAAGVLEAAATKYLIQDYEKNRFQEYCAKLEKGNCARFSAYVRQQVNYMYETALAKRNQTAFWNQVYLVLQQLAGLTDHYSQRSLNFTNRLEPSIDQKTVLINWEADLFEMEHIIRILLPGLLTKRKKLSSVAPPKNSTSNGTLSSPGVRGLPLSSPPGHCSALVKYVNQNIYVGHTSWFYYTSMLRIQKKYTFPFRSLNQPKSPVVPGSIVVMSSYPGCIFSLDEFYLINSGLFVTETTLNIYDQAAMRHCKKNSVPTWIRSLVANRLANSAQQWAANFSQENSGTYNNQYMIVDYKKFEKDGRKMTDNVFWVLEQMPGSFVSKDMSQVLRNTSFFASFNIPLFEKTRKIGGYEPMDDFTDFFNYETSPRKLIFNRDHHKVNSTKTMLTMMRYNDYEHDSFSTCQECKPRVRLATLTIAARGDLVDLRKKPSYIFSGLFGATDAKALDLHSFKRQIFAAINGPTNDIQPTFRWNSTEIPRGHPEVFNFSAVFHEFEKDLQNSSSSSNSTKDRI